MTQSTKNPASWQSINADMPEVHKTLQQVAKAIYLEMNVIVHVDQQIIQVNQLISLGFLKQQEDRVAFAELALQAEYLVEYAANQLVSAWDDIGIFLDTVDHLHRCSILLDYDLAIGAESLCILAREHGKDVVSRITEVATLRSNESVTQEQFWHLYELFCSALSKLKPEPRRLADALEVIENANSGSIRILHEMQNLLKQSQETVEAFYQEFSIRTNPLFVEFVFTTLLILSHFDLKIVHQRALFLTRSDDLLEIKLGVNVLGRISYGSSEQSDLLTITLDCFNTFLIQQNAEITPLLARAYGDLLDQSDAAVANFVKLSSYSDLAIRQEAAQVLYRRAEQFHQQNWYKESLLALLQNPLPHPEVLKQIDFSIHQYVNTEPDFAIQVIEVIALSWNYVNGDDNAFPNVIQYTLTELFNHHHGNLSATLTQWFASKTPRLHRAAYEVEHFFASMQSNDLNASIDDNLKSEILLSKPILDSLDEISVKHMLLRIVGYVTGGVSLSALILSVAQRESISQSIVEQIVILLSDYVIYNYPNRAKMYLRNRLTEEAVSEVESLIIHAALERFDHYLQARQSLPLLKELQSPPSRVYAYYQAEWKHNLDIVEQAKERSIFGKLFGGREIPIKYGNASAHFDKTVQKVSEPMRFAPLSYEYEVPQSDVIDPVGRAYQRWQWRLVGLEQAMNTVEGDSAEPEV
jgi:hypothetical protein